MNSKQKGIIKGYCWTATGLGVVLGPGADAAPLAALWLAGFAHLAGAADLDFDRTEVKSAIATIVAGFGAWFVSGKVAQIVARMLVAGGLAGAGVTGGLTLVVGMLATLSLNATINALFTYRFLNACASVIEDNQNSDRILLKSFANAITHQLISLAEIPNDLGNTAKIMFRF